MGFMSQRYVPHCCLVYLTEKQKYLTKIIKCDEELIEKELGSIDIFYMKKVIMVVKFMLESVTQ